MVNDTEADQRRHSNIPVYSVLEKKKRRSLSLSPVYEFADCSQLVITDLCSVYSMFFGCT